MRALLSMIAFAIGCSTSPGDPTLPTGSDGKPTTREFAYGCPVPTPAATDPSATFTSIYDDLLSADTGVAKCQASGCHGGSKGNGELSLGHTKVDAFCGMVTFGLIAPDDCSACSFCSADAGGCGAATCCCPMGSDAGADAGTSQSAGPLLTVVLPDGAGNVSMPRPFCGNRGLSKTETDAIKAWGSKGAPFD